MFSPLHRIFSPFHIFSKKDRCKTETPSQLIPTKDPLLQKLSGFYGLIGPDRNMTSVRSLYELFTGDGLIQGIFFDKGKMTFVKHLVRTDKIVYESIHGKLSNHVFMTPLYIVLNKLGVLPNVLGLANTALLSVEKKTYALFERDSPYEIRVDVDHQRIQTLKKKVIPHLDHFSGHSKYENKIVHTIDYDVIHSQLTYIRLNHKLQEKDRHVIKTKYLPLVHDFVVMPDGKLLFVDSPFAWDLSSILSESIILQFLERGILPDKTPVVFHPEKPAYIHLYDPLTKSLSVFTCKTPFYMFHAAYTEKEGENIALYAPLYDQVDFSSLSIDGKYRKIILKPDHSMMVQKNAALERMNLDFPIKWGPYIVLRSIENNAIREFVVCKGLDIRRRIRLPADRSFCGESAIVDIEGAPYLIGFSYDKEKRGYLSLVGIWENIYVEEPIHSPVTMGFHSLFLQTNCM